MTDIRFLKPSEPVKYPSREVDSDTSEDLHVMLVDELLDCETMVTSPSSNNFKKSLQHDCIDGKFGTVRPANEKCINENGKRILKKETIYIIVYYSTNNPKPFIYRLSQLFF